MTDLDLMIATATQAGDVALRYFNRDPQVWHKADNAGPVTEADLAVDAHLRDTLTAARPDYGWLSEETQDNPDRLGTRRQFIVDPIDGTRAFIQGDQGWSISLALVEDLEVIAGVVFLPASQQLYTAERGKGAFLNGVKINTAKTQNFDEAEILAARPNFDPQNWKDLKTPSAKRNFRSSLAYRLCLVADGSFDAMLTFRKSWEWDIAAGVLMVSEAGGVTTDRSGAPLRFNNPHPQTNGVIAANPALHGDILKKNTWSAEGDPLDRSHP